MVWVCHPGGGEGGGRRWEGGNSNWVMVRGRDEARMLVPFDYFQTFRSVLRFAFCVLRGSQDKELR